MTVNLQFFQVIQSVVFCYSLSRKYFALPSGAHLGFTHFSKQNMKANKQKELVKIYFFKNLAYRVRSYTMLCAMWNKGLPFYTHVYRKDSMTGCRILCPWVQLVCNSVHVPPFFVLSQRSLPAKNWSLCNLSLLDSSEPSFHRLSRLSSVTCNIFQLCGSLSNST